MKRKFLDVTKYHKEAEKIAKARRKADGAKHTWQSVLRECIEGGLALLAELVE